MALTYFSITSWYFIREKSGQVLDPYTKATFILLAVELTFQILNSIVWIVAKFLEMNFQDATYLYDIVMISHMMISFWQTCALLTNLTRWYLVYGAIARPSMLAKRKYNANKALWVAFFANAML